MRIHPTAIVHPDARVASTAEVGPYCVLGAQVEIGDGCVLQSHVVLEGEVRIGRESVVGTGSAIGGLPQDLAFRQGTRSGVIIGNRNTIREHCTIHRGTSEASNTVIGDDNFVMAGAHLGHNARLGNKVIVANNCLLGGYVEIGDGAFLGGASVFHQHVRVGRLVITQGVGKVGKDAPPFTLAAGLNTVTGLNNVGLRRAKFSAQQRDQIKRAFKLFYLSGLNVTQALEKAHEEQWDELATEFFEFIAAAKKRGICRYRGPGFESPSDER